MLDAEQYRQLESAIQRGATRYFAGCRAQVEPFVRRHFRYPGVWQVNKQALGWDLLRAPINLFWAPFYLLLLLLGFLLGKLGWTWVRRWLYRTPSGMITQVQRYLTEAAFREVLQRPMAEGETDRLHQCIVEEIESLPVEWVETEALTEQLNTAVHDALSHYAITRTASADITNSILSAALGAFAFQKFTPGGIAVGLTLSSWVSYHFAVNDFFLGETLGSLYYSVISPSPSPLLTLLTIGAVLLAFAIFSTFSGFITDPIQRWLRLHHYRLNRMIDQLEKDFHLASSGGYRPKDHYLARILDILDTARAQLL